MNYIYDIVLNFFDSSCSMEFFQWSSKDKIIYIDEIPLFRIDSDMMYDIINYKVVVDNELILKIHNKTKTDSGIIEYSCLVCDCFRVLALLFDKFGNIEKISNLIFDEEDEVIINTLNLEVSNFKIEKKYKYNNNIFLTRKEKKIQRKLLLKLEKLYKIKCYDEIDYLYREMFSDNLDIDEEYNFLINDIMNNFDIKYEKIYDVIRLTE